MNPNNNNNYTIKEYLKFIVPSIIGVLLFIFPFEYNGETTIVVAFLASLITDLLENSLPILTLVIISFTAVVTLINQIFQPEFIRKSKFLRGIALVSPFWATVNYVGFLLAALTFFNVGPEWIWSENTGGLVFYDLILGLLPMFFIASLFLPLLTDFGLLEFIGVLLTPIMRPLFNLPGRSSLDAVASFVGDGTIGVSLTNKQYKEGYYTEKEAAVISTNFSAVSITFTLVVLRQVDLVDYFGSYYLTIILATIVAAIIVPKLPPLSRKEDRYFSGEPAGDDEKTPEQYTQLQWATKLAIDKAEVQFQSADFLKHSIVNAMDLVFGVLPVIMTFGTVALIIAEYTPFFSWLGIPFIPLLKLLNVPYAVEASQTIMVGFADMFLPSIIASSIPSDMTRFIVATLSVTQLVYLSEAGAVILGSEIDISPLDLFLIFFERTLVTLPIIVLAAHIIF